MPRYAAIIEYHGHAYAGWQWQGHTIGVQQVVEEALAKIANEPVDTICAGRTDAGVHASHQVVHFDVSAERPDKAWLMGGNIHLPPDISVRWAGRVADDFNARFSALARRYRYVIYNKPGRTALLPHGVTPFMYPLDVGLMQQGAQHFLGEQDFSSVRAAECSSATAWRNIHHLNVFRLGDYVVVDIAANAFLHHMVRNIVGTLLQVGQGNREPGWVAELLKLRDRKLAPGTAPACGLYLVGVKYPARFQIPVLAAGPLWLGASL